MSVPLLLTPSQRMPPKTSPLGRSPYLTAQLKSVLIEAAKDPNFNAANCDEVRQRFAANSIPIDKMNDAWIANAINKLESDGVVFPQLRRRSTDEEVANFELDDNVFVGRHQVPSAATSKKNREDMLGNYKAHPAVLSTSNRTTTGPMVARPSPTPKLPQQLSGPVSQSPKPLYAPPTPVSIRDNDDESDDGDYTPNLIIQTQTPPAMRVQPEIIHDDDDDDDDDESDRRRMELPNSKKRSHEESEVEGTLNLRQLQMPNAKWHNVEAYLKNTPGGASPAVCYLLVEVNESTDVAVLHAEERPDHLFMEFTYHKIKARRILENRSPSSFCREALRLFENAPALESTWRLRIDLPRAMHSIRNVEKDAITSYNVNEQIVYVFIVPLRDEIDDRAWTSNSSAHLPNRSTMRRV